MGNDLQTCNCRWDGDSQVQQCTLHQAHVDAIHEWAERARGAEAERDALAAKLAELEGQKPVAWYADIEGWGREYNGCPELSNGVIGKPLYARPVPALLAHVFRELVNDLRDIARTWHSSDQLRERISGRLRDDVSPAGVIQPQAKGD